MGLLIALKKEYDVVPTFIPDTNVLRRRYFTNFFHSMLNNTYARTLIPRLAILENENKYNRNVGKNVYEPEREVRLALYTMTEIANVQDWDNGILPLTDQELIVQYTSKSGSGYADAWLRREVLEYITKRENRGKPDRHVFMTCDRMNAMCASAEGLDTLFISRNEENKFGIGMGHYTNLSELIIETAITIGHCDCIIKSSKGQGKKISFSSWWAQKSLKEWQDRSIMIGTYS